jgi:hypothetical protein
MSHMTLIQGQNNLLIWLIDLLISNHTLDKVLLVHLKPCILFLNKIRFYYHYSIMMILLYECNKKTLHAFSAQYYSSVLHDEHISSC